MNVPCDDMEKIGFREQRRAKPSGTRWIDLVGVMAAPDDDSDFSVFSERGGVTRFLETP